MIAQDVTYTIKKNTINFSFHGESMSISQNSDKKASYAVTIDAKTYDIFHENLIILENCDRLLEDVCNPAKNTMCDHRCVILDHEERYWMTGPRHLLGKSKNITHIGQKSASIFHDIQELFTKVNHPEINSEILDAQRLLVIKRQFVNLLPIDRKKKQA
ncbi:MAG: hypothetical protein LBJ73_01825 [Rickettsiales bacterium]|jgi:hypothetical protein|nr:hypothetical protein [Rickettsiales bacterium]